MTQRQKEERKHLLEAVLDVEIKHQQTSPYPLMSKIEEDLEKELTRISSLTITPSKKFQKRK